MAFRIPYALTVALAMSLVNMTVATPVMKMAEVQNSSFSDFQPLNGTILRFDLTVEDIQQRTVELIEQSRKTYDTIASLSDDDLNYTSVIKALADDDTMFYNLRTLLDFPQYVSPNDTIRAASTESEKLISEYIVNSSMRVDVYEKVNAYSLKNETTELVGEAERYLQGMLGSYRRSGLHLDAENRTLITEIKNKMNNLGIDFSQNLNEVNTKLQFTAEQLDGVSEDFIASLTKVEGSYPQAYEVTLAYPHVFAISRKCVVADTRKQMNIAFNSRCMEKNSAILEELVTLRDQMAKILGYPTHAEFVTEALMSGGAKEVGDFLSDLADKLTPLGDQEMASLLALKEEEVTSRNEEFDGKINAWDISYYQSKINEKQFQVDHQALQEYFPLHAVTNGLLNIYQNLLGLKFNKVENAHTWHEDVELYSVDDVSGDAPRLLGYFYLDLHPREGKYGHAACFGLQPSCINPSGERQPSAAACVTNFSKPTATKPSLLTHSEVETYFHEFGHVMHNICAQANFSAFAGTAVERDFVEAPSQMLENWCWEKESLRLMSEHYLTGEPIPDEMIDNLVASKKSNAGLLNKRQILLATFDQTIHQVEKVDTAEVFADLSTSIWGIDQPENTNMPASFGHLAGGYDARYYGYLWSEVYSADMFATRFAKDGILNSTTGMDYRNSILAPGGSRNAMDSLVEFLGREPNAEAFLISKGYVAPTNTTVE